MKDDYVTLFNRMPLRVRNGVKAGRWSCSLTALRRWAKISFNHRLKVIAELKRCGSLDVAMAKFNRVTEAQRLAKRQRRMAKNGYAPDWVINRTPPTFSPDRDAFFLPPPKPDRQLSWHQESVRGDQWSKRYVL